MKFRKLIASLAAAAVAVSAMAVSASAAEIDFNGYGESDDYGSYINPAAIVSDMSQIATVEIVIEGMSMETLNGVYELSSADDNWAWDPVNFSADNTVDNGDGTVTVTIPCSFGEASIADGFAKINIQNWDEATSPKIVGYTFKDASGAVLASAGAAAESEEATSEETTAEETTAAETTAEETTAAETTAAATDAPAESPTTGNAPVVAVAAVAAIAAGAVVASRKRK